MPATLDLGNLLVHMKMDASQYMSMMRSVEARMKMTSQRLTAIGRQMSMRITLPLAIMGGVALKTMASLETAFTGVRKTVNATAEEFAWLKKGFEDMSLVVPIAITELYGIGEAAGQLGIQTRSILEFSRVMADLGVTTNLTAQEAAMALARFANITRMSQDDFDRLGATIVDLGNNLATTEAEIVTMSLRMAGVGKVVNLTEHSILALAAAVSSVGIRAEAGGSAMSRVMLDMNTYVKQGAKELEALARVAGVTTKEFARSFEQNAAVAIHSFVEGLDRVRKSGVDVARVLEGFGWQGIRITRVLLALAGASDVLEESLIIGERAWKDNTALLKEAELRYGTFASQVVMLWNKLKLISNEIGNMLKPAVIRMMDTIDRAIIFWNLMEDSVKRNIIVFAGVVAAIGPVLLITGLLIKSLVSLLAVGKSLAVVYGILSVVMFSMTAQILLLAGIIYVLRAAWEQNMIEIKVILKQGFEEIANSIIGKFITWMGKTFIDSFRVIGKGWKDFIADIAAGAAAAWAFLRNIWRGWSAANEAWAESYLNTLDGIEKKLGDFGDASANAFKTGVITLKAFGIGTVEHLSKLMDAVKTQFAKDADAVIALIKSYISKMEKEGIVILPPGQIDVLKTKLEGLEAPARAVTKSLSDAQEEVQVMLKALDIELGLLGKISEERERAVAQAEFERAVKKAYIGDLEEQNRLISLYGKKMEELMAGRRGIGAFQVKMKQWASDTTNVWSNAADTVTNAFDRMGDELANALIEGKANFKDFAKSVMRELLAIIIRATIARAIMSFIMPMLAAPIPTSSPLGPGVTPEMALASGQPFQRGGVVHSPTLSLLGEAGSEAVVPLSGGRSIPVELRGEQLPSVTINLINESGKPLNVTDTQVNFNEMKEMIINTVIDDINRVGATRDTIVNLIERK